MSGKHGRFTEPSYVMALCAISVLIVVSTSVAFVESYDGLLLWSKGHGLKGWRADAWPLQVDAFIAIGEAALFVATLKEWDRRGRIFAWAVTLSGAVVSVAANIGHVESHDWADQVTAALPPLAACGGLTIGLQILKRVIADRVTYAHGAGSSEPAVAPVSWKIINGRVGWTVDLALRGSERPVDKILEKPERGELPPPESPAEKQPEPSRTKPRRVDTSRDDRWEKGVLIYRESIAIGNPLSQRELADALDMKNRTLAAKIIKHVKGNDNED